MSIVHQERIKQQIEQLLTLLGIEGSVVIEDREGQMVFNIKTSDSRLLIGQYGAHLRAFQHLVRLLVRRARAAAEGSEGEEAEFYVDIEGYRRNRDEFLRALSYQAAERVRQTHQTLVLKPMSSLDRRVIHSVFSDLPDLVTESIGEDPERRIVIKLKK